MGQANELEIIVFSWSRPRMRVGAVRPTRPRSRCRRLNFECNPLRRMSLTLEGIVPMPKPARDARRRENARVYIYSPIGHQSTPRWATDRPRRSTTAPMLGVRPPREPPDNFGDGARARQAAIAPSPPSKLGEVTIVAEVAKFGGVWRS